MEHPTLRTPYLIAAALLLAMAHSFSAHASLGGVQLAARPAGGVAAPSRGSLRASDPLVRRIQEALAKEDRYHGPIDGHFNVDLEEAIHTYQKENGLTPDGLITEELAAHLETRTQVGALLRRLESARAATIEAARRALLSRPATRELLEGGDGDTADPTRDAAPCFRNPTARCLLAEASESAKAVFKPEMRDWALGEVLVAQAKAGLTEEAMDTVRRIRDPRLIMVALRDIAKAQAEEGRSADALAAAEIIPDNLRRLEALEAIASIQAKDGGSGLETTLRRYLSALEKVDDEVKGVAFRARLAVIVKRSGDEAASASHLAQAEALARAIEEASKRGPALRHVASALAETGNPERALALLKEVEDKTDHTPVLVTAATAQARAGDAERALATASAIEAERYRAVVLSQIAVAQAGAGNRDAARETVNKANAATEEIKLPFARDYAHNRVSLALIEIGDYEEALLKAGDIDDIKLRATVLWTIAAAQERAGLTESAARTAELAGEATDEIKSALSRVWMFSDIALSRARAGESKSAWAVFDRALAVAEDMDNAWARARALGKAASTLFELSKILSE